MQRHMAYGLPYGIWTAVHMSQRSILCHMAYGLRYICHKAQSICHVAYGLMAYGLMAYGLPSPTPYHHSRMESGNVPYESRATSYPRQQHNTFAFLPLFSISTLIKIFRLGNKKKSPSLIRVSRLPVAIYQKKICTSKHFHPQQAPHARARLLRGVRV